MRLSRQVKTAAVAKRNSECAREEDLENFKKQIDAKDKHLTVFVEQEQARQGEPAGDCVTSGLVSGGWFM